MLRNPIPASPDPYTPWIGGARVLLIYHWFI